MQPCAGSSRVTTNPPSGALAAVALPPWTSKVRRVIASPNPVRSGFGQPVGQHPVERHEQRLDRVFRHARAVIADLDDRARAAGRLTPIQRDLHARPLGGVPHRVAHDVLDRAAQHLAGALDHAGAAAG